MKDTIQQRVQTPDCDPEEKEEHLKFISKIKPFFLKDFAEHLEFQAEEKKAQDVSNTQLKVEPLLDQIRNFIRVISKIHQERSSEIGSLMFDKDDAMAV